VIGYPKGELRRNTLAELLLPFYDVDPFALAIVPKSGTVSKGTFKGWGTASCSSQGWRMAIGGGGYFGFGGLMASDTSFSPNYLKQVMTTDPGHNTVMPSIQLSSKVNPNSTTFASNDPIDMRTGAYYYEVTDAVLPGAPGLAFERYYSTERRLDKSPRLGFGWTHNLNRFVVDQTEYELALGMGRPEDAAAMLAALAVGGDLMKAAREATLPINSIATQRNYPLRAKAAVTAALVANWAVDQLNDNAVVVVLGKTTLRFLRNPSLEGQPNAVETFLSPPGMQHLTLIKEPVSPGSAVVRYVLKRRNEGQAVFLKKGSLYRCDHDADSHNNRIRFTYDDSNRLSRVRVVPNGESATDSSLPSFTFAYDTSGRMATVSTSFGVAARFSYSSGPILTGVAQRTAGSPARKWSYAYDPANRMWKLTDPNSRVIATNEYDHLSRVIRQHALGYANAAGQTHTWRYAWGGEENIETDPKGGVTRYFFDDQGRGTVVEDATGGASIFVHDREDRVVQELRRDSSGALLSATARDYDPVTGLLMKEEVFDVGNANSTFDGVNVTVFEGQQNAVTEYDYYPGSLLLKEVTLPKGGKISTTYYPGTVNVATVTDPLQRVTSYTNYDLRGNAQAITRPGNRVTTTQFDRLSRPTRITYPDAQFTQFEWQNDPWLADGPSATFDQRGRGSVTSVSLPASAGKVVTVKTGTVSPSSGGAVVAAPDDFNISTYDASGNPTIIENRKGARWVTMYDGMGHATGTVGPRGETTTSIYDGRGWLVETFDPFGTRTSYERNTVDRVDAATVHLMGSEPRRVETDYDGLGRVKSVRDPLQRHSHTSYVGSTGGVLSGINPLQHEFRQGYDVEGNRVVLVNRRSGQWKFAYDQAGRPVATQTPNGSLYRQTWTPGRDVLASIQEPSGQTTQFTAYDSMDRLLTKVDPVGTTQYGYDSVGRLVTVIENGQTITRGYNYRDQLTSITNGRGERLDFGYRPDGLLQTVIYPADPPLLGNPDIWNERKQVSYDYDEYGRLRMVIDWKQRTTTYDYDKAGRVRRITLPNGSVRTRVYDDAGQTREIRDFWAESGRLIALQRFDYNGAGEVKSRLGVPFDYGKAPGSFSAIYDAENRLFAANGVVTSHDDDGNLLFAADPLYGGTMALSYNSRNQLLSAAVGGVSGSFTYDAEGHRQSVTHAGQTSTFTVNPAAELSQVLVRQVEGGQRTWAVYGLGLLYEVEIESVGEPEFQLVGGDIMMLVSQVTERLRVHHYDQTGNTVAITDGQGRDVLWVQYDAYGAVVHAESPTQADGGAPVRPEVNALPDGLQRALAVTPWLYVGEHGVMSDPTGLLYMRARYYHPGLRRFLNADPIQFEGGMNWYGYAGGNPVMGMDPSGLVAMPTYGGWKKSDGSINWAVYIAYALAEVPDYLAQNGWSSFKRNISDPRFIMENAGGGFGIAGALNRGMRTTATSTSRISVAVGEDMSSAAGVAVWRQIPAESSRFSLAQQGVSVPRGVQKAGSLDMRAMGHDFGTTTGSGLTSWTADLRFAQMRQMQSGGLILQGVAPQGSFWMNAAGVAIGNAEAQVLIPGLFRGVVVGGGQNVLGGLGTLGGMSMLGNAIGGGCRR
jgi:RHS repeat-associated protein